MRNFSILLIIWLFVSSCQSETKELVEVNITLFPVDSLEYPISEIKISDSTRTHFLKNFFIPWNKSSTELQANMDKFPGKDLSYLQNYLADDEWYGENKKPHKKFLREEIVNAVSTADFPNFMKKGIVVAHTNLRRIPSNRPGFDKYSKAGEGFPFDYFQETNLWANTPLQLLHLTKDKEWCYVISPYYKGWVQMHDLGVVSEEFIDLWQKGNYAMPLTDQIHLMDSNSNYSINGKIGMVVPYMETEKSENVLIFYSNTDENQNAKILRAEVPRGQVALNDFKFGHNHLKGLVSNLIARPYGWGGNLENRDCSSLIRDMMATYQIWLPRDSKDQIETGRRYELEGTLEEKMTIIKENGIPFQTILRKKGHNMLYVGNNKAGEPLIFHAIWGLKTSYANAQLSDFLEDYPIEGIHLAEDGTLKGRHIIGESVITSVMAGAKTNQMTLPLLEEIYAMTNFLEK